MTFSKQIFTNSIKKVSATTLVGICALFGTHMLISTELNAATTVPTSYNLSELYAIMNRQIPDGYAKMDYKVNFIEKGEKPSASELSLEDAAEIMAQEIFRFSKEDLSNQTLDMIYTPSTTCHTYSSTNGNETYESLASWDCSLKLSNYTIIVSIDSSTGELSSIEKNYPSNAYTSYDEEYPGKLDPQTKQALDTANEKFKMNEAQNLEKAKTLIIQSGYVATPIQLIEYQSTNFNMSSGLISYNFNVTTTSNKHYLFELSEDLMHFNSVLLMS